MKIKIASIIGEMVKYGCVPRFVPHGWAPHLSNYSNVLCDISRMQIQALPTCILTKSQPTDVKYFHVKYFLPLFSFVHASRKPSSHSRLFVSHHPHLCHLHKTKFGGYPSSPQGYSWLASRIFNYRYFCQGRYFIIFLNCLISVQLRDLTISRSLFLLDWSSGSSS
jgi:hypothetical protein